MPTEPNASSMIRLLLSACSSQVTGQSWVGTMQSHEWHAFQIGHEDASVEVGRQIRLSMELSAKN